MEPIHKFNNGRGAMLCNTCRTIISTGPATKELYCEKCKPEEEKRYSEADMHTAWNSSEQNMRFQFGSSAYKNITFERWLLNFNEE